MSRREMTKATVAKWLDASIALGSMDDIPPVDDERVYYDSVVVEDQSQSFSKSRRNG